MKTIVRRVVKFQCEACGTKYSDKKDARTCEAMPVEEKKFEVGDKVRGVTYSYVCERDHRHAPIKFLPVGKVVSIRGPQRFDEEYEIKWLFSRGLGTHVFQYEVVFYCPLCPKSEGKRSALFYAPELTSLKSKKI